MVEGEGHTDFDSCHSSVPVWPLMTVGLGHLWANISKVLCPFRILTP